MRVESAERRRKLSALPVEEDDVAFALDREDVPRPRDGRRGERRRIALPAEGAPGERLEPRLLLRVERVVLQPEVEVRPGRVAGRADESDRITRGANPRPSASRDKKEVKAVGLEPTTYGLKVRCSTD